MASIFENQIDKAMGVCVKQFGDACVYIPAEGEKEYDIYAIFEEAETIIYYSGEVPVETRAPVLGVRLSDFEKLGVRKPKQNDRFKIKGKLYIVVQKPQDGWSESRLVLFCKGAA